MQIRKAALEQEQKSKLAEKEKEVKPESPSPEVKVDPLTTVAITQQFLSTSTDGDERVFVCHHDGCVSSFKTRSSLRDHQKGKFDLSVVLFSLNIFIRILVHSDLRPYICAFCSSAFKSSSNRSKHERGSHTQQYQKRKLARENQRNGNSDEATAPKRVKLTPTPSTPKVIKQEPVVVAPVVPPKKTVTDFPCRYCDRIFRKAENRDRHEATHKDFNAFGKCFKPSSLGLSYHSSLTFRLRILF